MLKRLMGWLRRPRYTGLSPEARLRPARDVLAAERDGLIVLLDLRREVYLGLDEVGTTVWRAIEGGARLEQVKHRVAEEYDAPVDAVAQDTVRFVNDLAGRCLVMYT